MTIKQLKKILKNAPDEDKTVYVNDDSQGVLYSFDDRNDLVLYQGSD